MADSYLVDIKKKADALAEGLASMAMRLPDPEFREAAVHGAIVGGFVMGLEEGIRMYAIWKDGVQLVGAMQRPLAEVLGEVRQVFGLEETEG